MNDTWRRFLALQKKTLEISGGYIGKFIILLVRAYQKIPHAGVCRYTPSCSAYMILAVEKHGCAKGFFMGVARILRCNPFFKGGADYP